MQHPTVYRTIQIDGLSIFYREAGPKNAPTILLLHGLPSSSRMFEPLFDRLSDHYHLVAPDYPGFGHSDWPDPKKFTYTFDHIAEVMNHFTEALGLSHFNLYMQDYGGPVGFRMILAHPDRVERLIVQDAVAHNEGLGANWKTRRAFWADRAAYESALRTNLLSLETTRARHADGDPNVERHNPDLWTDEYYFLNQPGQGDIQVELFYDYRTNVENYPKWQAWMKKNQPQLLVIWGKYESSFDPSEPESYRRDVTNAEVHIVDGGLRTRYGCGSDCSVCEGFPQVAADKGSRAPFAFPVKLSQKSPSRASPPSSPNPPESRLSFSALLCRGAL